MEDRDKRPETYTIDPGEAGDLGDFGRPGDRADDAVDPALEATDTVPARPPVHARARIKGAKAGVAAGLVPPVAGEGAAAGGWSAPELPDVVDDDDDIWGDYDAAQAAASQTPAPLPSLLPDWRDPPTREVPRVLLEHPLADSGPSYPGPVWRETDTDWDDDDATFADIVHEGTSVADHGLGIDEPDPYAFDFVIGAVGARPGPVADEEDEVREAPVGRIGQPRQDRGTEEPGSTTWVPDSDEGEAAAAGSARRAARGVHRSRVSLASRLRRPDRATPPVAVPAPAHLSAPPPPAPSKRNPVIATATGLAAGGAVLLFFLAGPPEVLALVTVVLVVAAAECYQAARRARYRPAVLLGLLAVVADAIAGYLKGPEAIPIVGAGLVIATLCWYVFGLSRRAPVANLGATVMGWAWVGLLGGFATLLLDPRVFPHRHGLSYLLGAIVATVAYDVGGYAFGSWIGTHSLAPSVSPNKTWEGLAGGCFAAVAVSVGLVSHLHPWTSAHALELGIVVAIFAPLGDLAESMVKRDIGVKDMGTLLPAHGGMLDRVDGLLFVLPAVYCLVRLFHG